MGWSTDWLIPRAMVPFDELAAAVRDASTHLGATVTCADQSFEVAFRGRDGRTYSGWLEVDYDVPDRHTMRVVTEKTLTDQLIEADPTLDDENYDLLPKTIAAVAPIGRSEALVSTQSLVVMHVDLVTAAVRVEPLLSNEERLARELASYHYMTLLRREPSAWWVGGTNSTLFRRPHGGAWTEVPLDGSRATVCDVCELGGTDLLVVRDADVRVLRDGRLHMLDGALPQEDTEGFEIEDGTTGARRRGDAVWFTHRSRGVYCLEGGRIRHVELPVYEGRPITFIDIDDRGEFWIAARNQVFRGDGERWDVVLDLNPDDEVLDPEPGTWVDIKAMCAGRDGTAWITDDRRGLFHLSSRGFERVDVGEGRVGVPVAAPGGGACMIVHGDYKERIVSVRPPGQLHTRLTVRSTKNDNREDACWAAMGEVGNRIATALGGWIVDD